MLSTEPRFTLKVSSTKGGKNPFHQESPAGRFLIQHPELLENYSFEFGKAQSGFGGSSAEFLLISAFEQLKSPLTTESQLDLDLKKTLSDYGVLFDSENNKPSGADIVGQARGFITAFYRKAGRIQNFNWNFPNLSFLIFKTGKKLATHEHLKGLKSETFEELEGSCHQVWESFAQSIENHLIVGLTEFTQILEKKGLQDPNTMQINHKLKKLPGVRVAKGCGAFGADAVLLIVDRREASLTEIKAKAKAEGLEFFADEKSLAKGLQKDPFTGAHP